MSTFTATVTEDSFSAQVLESILPVLVDFWADWCGPCKMLVPTLEEIAREFSNKIKVVKVDIDKSPHLQKKYNIRSIPTLLLFKDSKIVATKTGLITKNQIVELINTSLNTQ